MNIEQEILNLKRVVFGMSNSNDLNIPMTLYTTVSDIIIADSENATITSANVVKWGKVVQLRMTWTNKKPISVGAGGNIENVVVGTLKAGFIPKIFTHAWSNGDDAGAAWYSIDANGLLRLGAMEAGYPQTIEAGAKTFNVGATFIAKD